MVSMALWYCSDKLSTRYQQKLLGTKYTLHGDCQPQQWSPPFPKGEVYWPQNGYQSWTWSVWAHGRVLCKVLWSPPPSLNCSVRSFVFDINLMALMVVSPQGPYWRSAIHSTTELQKNNRLMSSQTLKCSRCVQPHSLMSHIHTSKQTDSLSIKQTKNEKNGLVRSINKDNYSLVLIN